VAEIVNLRMARKRKVRAEQEARASEQRAIHGRSKFEKRRDRAAEEKGRAFVEGHFRGKPGVDQ
jgi:hypothetical protein